MRIYIAGKVSGLPYEIVRKDFYRAEMFLSRFGKVINPIKHCAEKWSWLRCMLTCSALVSTCHIVALMDNWQDSRGARWEYKLAKFLGKDILYLEREVVKEWQKGREVQKVMFRIKQ